MVVDLINAAAGLLGLALTAVTPARVRAVRRAQRDERTLIRTLDNTEAAATRIRAAAAHLARSRDSKAQKLAQDLILFSGQIEAGCSILPGRRVVDLLMYSPITVATTPALAALRDAAERGVAIRVLALSPDASSIAVQFGAVAEDRGRVAGVAVGEVDAVV